MADFLVDHALKNVWCTPNQDSQYIFKPRKISLMSGTYNVVEVVFDPIVLPTPNVCYHVYQLGQIPPVLLNLVEQINVWQPISRICRDQSAVIDLYANDGIQFPRHAAYILTTTDNNLIIAVRDIPQLPTSLKQTDLYIRFYSNAYFNSIRNTSDGHADSIYVTGKLLSNSNDLLGIQTAFAQYSAMVGYTYGFINGYYVDALTVVNMAVGDVVEFVYDSTIYRTFDYPVANLDTFVSTLDSKAKFLLHSDAYTATTIEFQDDIDFWLIRTMPSTRKKGLYFHKNAEDAVRTITHRDYSITAPYVQAYVDQNNLVTSLNDLTIRMHIRRSGYSRTLVNEAHRIKELYKMAPADVTRALLGMDSGISVWNAINLEASDYPRIMRTYEQFITRDLVTSAYGYNAISKIVADTPTTLTLNSSSQLVATLPAALQVNSTIYEYDVNGLLLGSVIHNVGDVHYAVNSNAVSIEAVTGIGGLSSSSVYDAEALEISLSAEYRYYKSLRNLDGSAQHWVLATPIIDYVIDSGVVTWLVSPSVYLTMVRGDDQFPSYTILTDSQDPVFRFSINANAYFGNSLEARPMVVPSGELDIWFNGHSLVPNIDYYVNWPEVCIVTKAYVVGTTTTQQSITVRARGFSDGNSTNPVVEDYGWVVNGQLSRNGNVNIRDDRVLRIVANGRLYNRTQLQFAENGTVINNSSLNGRPYFVRDIRVSLNGYINGSTHDLRLQSKAIDQEISDYLTLQLPEASVTGPSIGSGPYTLYSPFCAKIAMELYLGNITQVWAETSPTDTQIRAVMSQYEFLLQYDPCVHGDVPETLVSIHPHPYIVTIPIHYAGFRLLQSISRIYLNNRVSINNFFTII